MNKLIKLFTLIKNNWKIIVIAIWMAFITWMVTFSMMEHSKNYRINHDIRNIKSSVFDTKLQTSGNVLRYESIFSGILDIISITSESRHELTSKDSGRSLLAILNRIESNVEAIKLDVESIKSNVESVKSDVESVKYDTQGRSYETKSLRDLIKDIKTDVELLRYRSK